MSKKKLHQLYAEHTGKVSEKWSLYLTEFDRLFEGFRQQPVNLLEIGIQNGGSLEIWSKYFNHDASVLLGCDINPDCARLRYDDSRISVVVGDANAAEIYERILDRSPQFQVIIDDGSHRSGDIIKTFSLYFPLLADGGIYIAEDIHCSYWESFEGGLFDPFSAITFFKRLSDIANYEHWGSPGERTDNLRGIFWKYNCKMDDDVLSRIQSVEFMNSLCIIQKAPLIDEAGVAKFKRVFEEYRDRPIRLLETGIQNGASLENWSKEFPQASILTGCGINPAQIQLPFHNPRIAMIAGDANLSDTYEQIVRYSPEYDIIVANGLHASSDFIRAFTLYFSVLSYNGIIVFKDVHQSYGQSFESAMIDPFSAVNFFARLVDIINHDHWGVKRARGDILRSILSKYRYPIDSDMLSCVHSVTFMSSLWIVRKASPTDNNLGRLIIGGHEEPVTPGLIKTHSQNTYSDAYLLDQTFNPWTRLALAEEELACMEQELVNTRQVLEDLENELNQINSGNPWKRLRLLKEANRRIKMHTQKK